MLPRPSCDMLGRAMALASEAGAQGPAPGLPCELGRTLRFSRPEIPCVDDGEAHRSSEDEPGSSVSQNWGQIQLAFPSCPVTKRVPWQGTVCASKEGHPSLGTRMRPACQAASSWGCTSPPGVSFPGTPKCACEGAQSCLFRLFTCSHCRQVTLSPLRVILTLSLSLF